MMHTLKIPNWNPVRANQWYGKHWRVRWRLKNEQEAMLGLYAVAQEIPQATGKRRVRLTVYKPGQVPDRDAYDKLLLDCLVKCGLLTDDSSEGLEGRMEVIIVKAKERATEIRLEDVA